VFKTLTRPAALIAVIVAAAVGLAGCGESAEQKATASVCSSTKAIEAQISKLSDLSLSSNAPEEVEDAVAVMNKGAAKIDESTPNLPAANKAPVKSAQKTLRTETSPAERELSTRLILAGLATTQDSTTQSPASLEAVLTESEHAIAGLRTSYKQIYESLKCS
jgi:hypothetical protein